MMPSSFRFVIKKKTKLQDLGIFLCLQKKYKNVFQNVCVPMPNSHWPGCSRLSGSGSPQTVQPEPHLVPCVLFGSKMKFFWIFLLGWRGGVRRAWSTACGILVTGQEMELDPWQ